MVIALLGVWTSVAVVWFELVDYEEVLGKLGIYDADGDGDFDVEDAKVLLGLKERSVPAQPASAESEETVQPAEKPYVESEHGTADVELEEEIQSVLHGALHSQPGERHEDVDEGVSDQWQEKEEIHGEAFEAPATDDTLREFENEIPEAYETPDSVQKDADPMVDDVGAVESEIYEIPALDEYVADLEERVSEPDTPGDSEAMPEDAVEHYTEDRVHEEYSEDQEPKHEKQTETQDTEEINEDLDIAKDLSGVENKQTEDDVAIESEESEKPVKAEDYSNDVQVDT